MDSSLFEFGLVVIVAATLGVIMRLFRQPLILAYLVAGLLLGAFQLLHPENLSTFRMFADLGIMFLLFLIGLEINYASLRTVGKTAFIVGISQVTITSCMGFLIARLLHFSPIHAAYIGIALTFSSTIIIVKLLSEKRDTHSLYGKISIGFMLIQDVVAILLLVVLSGIEQGGSFAWMALIATLAKAIVLFIIAVLIGRKVLPRIFDRVTHSHELLFVMSLAWLFIVVAAVHKLGFSIEIGGFLAGLALANSAEHFQIASRMRPLRDFFIVIFFVLLGSSIAVFNFSGLTFPIIVFSLFVMIGNPLIVLILMSLLGYKKHTSFMSGLMVGQISEFSLVLVGLGLSIKHIDTPVVALITAVGIISITLSSYLILHAHRLYPRIQRLLSLFERKSSRDPKLPDEGFHKQYILIGAHRVGRGLLQSFPANDLLIIDFDPEIISSLRDRGYSALLGDIGDVEVLQDSNIHEAKIIVSTSPDLSDNLTLLQWVKNYPKRRTVILRAETDHDAEALYKKGADYVIRPHLTSGNYIADVLSHPEGNRAALWKAREKDFKIMKKEAHV